MGLSPQDMPKQCDSCNSQFTIEHVFNCKKGNLMGLHHDDMKASWIKLLGAALIPSAVRDEPLIHPGHNRGIPEGTTTTPNQDHGDISTHGFWNPGIVTIFDVSIANTDASLNLQVSSKKVLIRIKKSKKEKYLGPLCEQWKNSTPLIYSVDSLAGKEAKSATRKTSLLQSEKWGKTHSVVASFVNMKIALSLACSLSMCLRNSRNYPLHPHTWVDWTHGGSKFHLHQ